MEEIWKDVFEYEGLYQISNFGNARSLDRVVIENNTGKKRNVRGVDLKPGISKGYFYFNLYKPNSKIKKGWNHKLVAQSFLGHIPCGMELVINHKDNNPQNNHVDNLEITTQRKNSTYHKENKTGFAGVKKRRYGFQSELKITRNGQSKNIHIGLFNTAEIASAHRELAVLHEKELKSFSTEHRLEFRNLIKELYDTVR